MRAIWILGATGRSGRAVAERLATTHDDLVLVGRDATRLRAIASSIGGTTRILVVGGADAIVAELARSAPAVVINTIGPFTETAGPIARACPAGTHYVDLSNELFAARTVLMLHDEAVARGQTLVTGAGFGVLATESVVLKLCEGQPPAERVRVDAMASVESEPGRIGEALAATIVDVMAAGGRRYAEGRLVRARLLSDFAIFTLPDGSTVGTAGGASGELEAAQRASGAPFVVAASSLVPTAPALRLLLPPALTLLRVPMLRNLAKRRIAAIEIKLRNPLATPEHRHSWAHAHVAWPSGQTREGWLRMGDAMVFTTAAVVEVAMSLVRNEGRPGAYTPGALFGAGLAQRIGGTFLAG